MKVWILKRRNFTSLTFSSRPVHWDSWSGGTPRGTLPGTSPGTPPGKVPGTPPGTPPGILVFLGRVGGRELKLLPCLELERLQGKG